MSEHDTIVFEVMSRIKLTKQPPRTIYMYNRASWDALREELHTLLTIDTTELPRGNVEQLWSKVSISQVVDKHISTQIDEEKKRPTMGKSKHQKIDKKKR